MTTKSRKNGDKVGKTGFEDRQGLVLPFVQISGRWHVVINWAPGMKPGQNLDLRPLTGPESDWLEPEMENAVMEIWARLFPTDEAIRNGAEPTDETD